MNKSQLLANLERRLQHLNLSEAEIQAALEQLLRHLSHSLVHHQRIEIRGFGSFSCRYRPTRTARNPRQGTQVLVPSFYKIYFRAGLLLRQRLNLAASCSV